DEIKDIEVVPEDSHFLLYFFKDNIKYITKIRFSEDKLINSLVEEIYNEDNAQCVLVIEYDGSKYYGMQKQKRDDENTIQEEIEKALKLMMKRDVLVYPASRTDKGVHAKGQVLHFYANHIEAEKYMYALNNILPKDIRIKDAYIRSQLFNSRYDSILKTYNYVIDMGEYNVFMNNYVYYYKVKNISLMRNEMKSLLGTHDFKAFSKGKKEDTVRTIYDASLHLEGERLILSFTGNGFLHNMIRFIVGSLIEIDKKGFGSIKVILDSKDKNKTPILAPAEGLYLISIKY
ncbi:MAG: tRNA pseudouridine(38-40) synthase TruA, partial [Gammaproteobacteria bacterium]|nr:tRNA pseudouridine(38-40) synthase TruA [Gammaproteobacteria bacterium]